MKKIILIIAAFSELSIAAAQSARVGIKAGGLWTTAGRSDAGVSNVENKFTPGIYAGGLMEVSIKHRSDKVKLQLEADYSYMTIHHNFTASGAVVDEKSKAHMLSVPVLGKFFFMPNFSMYAGPSANFNLSSEATAIVNNVEYSKNTNEDMVKCTMGAMLGANYYIYKGLFVEARYHAVFPDYYRAKSMMPNYGPIHNFQLGAGFKF